MSVLVVLVDTVIIHCSTVPLTANCVCGGGLLSSTLLCIVGVSLALATPPAFYLVILGRPIITLV